jgi:PII-like signaling protein
MIEHVPVVIEIVDSADRIQQFVHQTLSPLMNGGMATLERANVMMYRDRRHDQPAQLKLGELLDAPLATVPTIQSGDPAMTINETGVLLRIFIGESDRAGGKPLHEAIVQEARKLGLAGATVLRGSEGFGANSVVHKAKLLEMSADLPIVIEIADAEPKIQKLLPYLEQVVKEGMITMEHVAIIVYRHDPANHS